jgi:dihydroorotate dehydrogenase (fumarate)
MTDLSTDYLGYRLRSPFVASSSPVTGDLDALRLLEDSGAGAVVLPSLFEEQLAREAHEAYKEVSPQAGLRSAAAPDPPGFSQHNRGSEEYLRFVAEAKSSVSIPVVASLNGVSSAGWGWYATELEATGVDALELNVHQVVVAPSSTAEQVESGYVDIVTTVRAAVRVPLAVKLGSSFTALPNLAARLIEAGASGLVLFNRFYDPDIALEAGKVVSQLTLSSSHELGERLRWLAILRPQLLASLAATGGIHTCEDAIKALMSGADVVMMASALLQHGPRYLAVVQGEVTKWMDEHGHESIGELKGTMSHRRVADPSAYERATYAGTLASFEMPPGHGPASQGP